MCRNNRETYGRDEGRTRRVRALQRRACVRNRGTCSEPTVWVHARGQASRSDMERRLCNDVCMWERNVGKCDARSVDVMRT